MPQPDKSGHFGLYGGRYVAETLMPALIELEKAYHQIRHQVSFQKEFNYYLKQYAGRPTPLFYANGLTSHFGGPKIYLKREDLLHTGAHKINNTIGQALIAKRMGKRRLIAETGAGQHGVATATVAALFGFDCDVYMGETDIERQSLNVFRMKLLGANVIPVKTGSRTLKDALNEALRDWVTNVGDTHYLIGSVAGPHPYPMIVRDLQSVIGRETKRQIKAVEGRLPNHLVACVGGGSNAMGLFYPFLKDRRIKMTGVEGGGKGLQSGGHAASLTAGSVGVLHGNKTYLLQRKDGQIDIAHSIAAGLDYPGVGPEHSILKDLKRVQYVAVKDKDALKGFRLLSEVEGIIPALEPAHAIAYLIKLAPKLRRSDIVIINLSGRGDKDIFSIAEALGERLPHE